jgi:uncharacterized protein YyaL (SSP411 family)
MPSLIGKLRGAPYLKALRAAVRALHPSLGSLLLRDFLGAAPGQAGSSREHLDATMAWLCRAQDQAGGRGVSAGYSLVTGWLPPYPETTGYIIPTFLDYAKLTGSNDFAARAKRMADWEIEVQLPSGAVQAGIYTSSKREPAVFNTGQVILGWCRIYRDTGDARYLNAASRAAEWLLQVQSSDGSWNLKGPMTETEVHAYDVRVAWSLLELHQETGDRRLQDAAKQNIEWTLSQQRENGWFESNAFFRSADKWNLPLTHTVAYVMEGLLESWRLLGDDRYLRAVLRTADPLLQVFESRSFMPGEFGPEWDSAAKYSCLTGNAQIAGVWLRISRTTGDDGYRHAAVKLNDWVKGTQSLTALHAGVRGGVKGSQPIMGRYSPFLFINWGAKFLADSLMLEEELAGGLKK